MARLPLSLFGPFEARLDGEPVAGFHSDKVRALLAYLAVESDRPHRRESLAGLLWPEGLDRAAHKNLSRALYNLRTAIGDRRAVGDWEAAPPFLLIDLDTLQFNRDSDHWLDVAAFTAAVDGRPGSGAPEGMDRVGELEEAVARYRGDFLEGFGLPDSAAFEDWTLLKRERLRWLILDAFGQLARHWAAHGEPGRALQYARRRIELEPWGEEGHRQVMRLLARSGRRGAALAQYEACRRALAEELGVEPDAETVRLYERIRDGELAATPMADETPPALGTAAAVAVPRPLARHNMPARFMPLVGRKSELKEIVDYLRAADCRLLTLVGPGGSGKTRLAVEAAARAVDCFPDGTCFVSLAPLRSAEAIVPTLARAIGLSFHGQGNPERQLLDYVRQKVMLLVLDNFEHLLARPAGPEREREEPGRRDGVCLLADILEAAPGVKVLATSRSSLGAQGEQRFLVGGLDVPPLAAGPSPYVAPDRSLTGQEYQHSAVQLFVHGARRVRRDFELRAGNWAHVVRICHLVRGMPLGVLLAAAWVGMLTPAEIAAQLTGALGLDLLEADWHDVPSRQRSMRAIFDHSWSLLSSPERAVMQALSLFRGGFTWLAAQRVSGATLRGLKGLVDRSLLHRTPAGRYELHELLRQYVAEKLAQREDGGGAARNRHTAYYVAAVESWAADLTSLRQERALEEMETEFEDVRAAWEWAVERADVESLDRAMDGLGLFRRYGGYATGTSPFLMAADKLAGTKSDRALRVRAKALLCVEWCWAGKGELSGPLAREGMALLEEPELSGQDTRRERAFALTLLGSEARQGGRYHEARRLWERSLALFAAVGDRHAMGDLMVGWGGLAQQMGADDEAQEMYEGSLAIGQEMGNPARVAYSLLFLGILALGRGRRFDEIERMVRESLPFVHRSGRGGLLGILFLFCACGEFTKAHALFSEILALCKARASGDVAFVRGCLGSAEAFLGRYQEARASAGAALALSRASGHPLDLGISLGALGRAALAEGAYAEARRLLAESLDAYRQAGRLDMVAITGAILACAERGLGRRAQAWEHVHEALRVPFAREFGVAAYALPVAALLQADEGQVERAVELYALVSQSPLVANSRWFDDVAGKHIAAAAEGLPPGGVAAAQERGRARDLWETARELRAEFEGK